MKIYADNAATTKMSPKAIKAFTETMENLYGNPSSLHSVGQKAAEALEDARAKIASLLGCNAENIYFTSGGSESDNQAILSAVEYGRKKGKCHIITTAFEHHAVLHTIKKLEKNGFEVTYLPVNEDGIVRAEDLEAAIKDDTALVSIMFANNEIGTIQPIEKFGEICKRHKVLFHTDAVQAVGHIKTDVESLGVDYLSLSAHKFRGPKGIGLLYAKKRAYVSSFIEGGAQERGKRAGTENLPAIVSMTAALEEALTDLDIKNAKVLSMRERLIDGLLEIPNSILNGDREKRLAGNVNVCFEGIEGESLLLMLDLKGISASSGSACTSGSLEPSHVLLSIGRIHEIAHGSLRLSIDESNTDEEIDCIIKTVKEVVKLLREMSPVWNDIISGKKKAILQ